MLYVVMGVKVCCVITFLAYGKLPLNKLLNPDDQAGSTYL